MTRKVASLVAAGAVAALFAACDKTPPPSPPPSPDAKLPSVNDLESPKADAPIVDAASYDRGYEDGLDSGEKAARKVPLRSKVPTAEEASVLALEAAGTDAKRGERWQRGFSSGYRDGFARITTGKK
jgi:hypothetical protein